MFLAHFPLVIIGAGPAGLGAAAEAAAAGIRTLVIDERPAPGGSVCGPLPEQFDETAPWLLPPIMFSEHQEQIDRLMRQCQNGPVEFALNAFVWAIFPQDPLKIVMRQGPGSRQVTADLIIIATGTYVAPEPPWGIQHEHVLTPASFYARVSRGISSLSTVHVYGKGLLANSVRSWAQSQGITVGNIPSHLYRHWQPKQHEYLVVAAPISAAIELPSLAGCQLDFHGYGPAFRPRVDRYLRSTVPNIYAVGSLIGLSDMLQIVESGRLAAVDAIVRINGLTTELENRRRLLARNTGLTGLNGRINHNSETTRGLDYDPGWLATVSEDFVLCSCMGLTRGVLQAAVDLGPSNLNDLKRSSGIGMGICQGRCCLRTALLFLSERASLAGQPGSMNPIKVRPPIRPLPLSALLPISEAEVADDD